MKKDKILSSMGDIDEKYILEYERARKARKQSLLIRAIALAASVCLVIGTAVAIPLLTLKDEGGDKGSQVVIKGPEGPNDTGSDPTEPTVPDEPKGPLKVLNVTAEKQSGHFISADTDFIVEAENATADLVREHIYISGGPEYTVTDEGDGKYRVSLAGNLSAGNVVSLSFAKEGVIEYSWAFETERKLEVSSTLPKDGAESVDVTTAIRIDFSMNTDTPLTDYATFTPHVEGRWEQIGKVHQFIPDTPLADSTLYTLTVKAGLRAGEYVSETDYVLSFDTGDSPSAELLSPFIYDIYNYTPEQEPVVRLHSFDDIHISRMTVSSFATYEDMLAYAGGNKQIVLSDEREVSFTKTKQGNDKYDLTIPPLEKGCYLVSAYRKDGVHPYLSATVQINEVSAYVTVTNEDIIVWSNRAGLTANYNGKSAVTDERGIAILKDTGYGGSSITHLTLSDGEDTQIAVIPDFKTPTPDGYIYCDKPVYRTTDKISFFGAVPLPLFRDGGEGSFTVELCLDGTAVLSSDVKPDENGAYHGSFSYNDLFGNKYEYLRLTYNGAEMARRYIILENYYLDNYTFTFEPVTDNLIAEGESYDFGVKVTHISGVPVQGKELCAIVSEDEMYYALTDENGVASFSIPNRLRSERPVDANDGQFSYVNVRVRSNDVTDGDNYNNAVLTTSFCNLNASHSFRAELAEDTFTLEALRFKTEADRIINSYHPESDENAVEGRQPLSGEITVYAFHYQREKLATTVDPDTGKISAVYSQSPSTPGTAVDTFKIENAEIYSLDLSGYKLPEADELNSYSYYVSYQVSTADGKVSEYHGCTVKQNSFVDPYEEQSSRPNYNKNGALVFDSYYNAHTYGYNLTDEEYHTYRYIYNVPYHVGMGETVDITVKDAVADKELTAGTLLRIIYRDGIIRADIVDAGEVDFEYTADLGPFFKLTLAYLKDGRFYRMSEATVFCKEEERTVTVTAETDKDSYAPGEEATVTVTLTDYTGAPISGTVNISVVNEALLKNNYHSTAILGDINRSINGYRLFTYSSFFDSELNAFLGGYGGGGGEDTRIDFKDTACFLTVSTDEGGVAKVTFTLPDNVTEYRITVHAVAKDMLYGVCESSVTTNMDFFLQWAEQKGLKSSDDFVPSVNSVSTVGYGTVDYTFLIKETGQSIDAYAFTGSAATVNFGKLEAGDYTLRVDATFGEYTDAIEYPFTVAAGAMHDLYEEVLQSGGELTFTPISYPVKVELYTKEAEFYRILFDYMDSLSSMRSDKAVSAYCTDRLYNSLAFSDRRVVGATLSTSYITDEGLLSLYKDGSADYVVSALTAYYAPHLLTPTLPIPENDYSYVLSLMLSASRTEAVLAELKAAESFARGDDTLTAVIGASYAMLGDYDGAKRMYGQLPERSEEVGADALRAFIATFVDRDNAGVLLHTLITEESDEPYLGFAVVSYMQNRIMRVTEDRTVTLTVNGVTEEYTVSGIIPKVLTYTRAASPTFRISVEGEGVCASVTYRAKEESKKDDYYVWLEGSFAKNSLVYLAFDADAFSGRITLDVALPPSLRLLSKEALGYYVWLEVQGERLRITLDDRTEGTVRIPLLSNAVGNYKIEPIRLTTETGNRYYSNELTLDIK